MTEAPGVFSAPNEPVFEDYFSFVETFTYVFPDGHQSITFSTMNEGMRSKYQVATNRDIRVDAKTKDVRLKADVAADRHQLILMSAVDYKIRRGGQWVPFDTKRTHLRDLLEYANPKIVDDIEKLIREKNPWLTDDLTVEAIDAEIERLQELREAAVRREREGESL